MSKQRKSTDKRLTLRQSTRTHNQVYRITDHHVCHTKTSVYMQYIKCRNNKKGSTWRYHVKGKISGTIQRCNSSPVLYLKLLIHRGKMPLDPISQDGVSIPCPLKN